MKTRGVVNLPWAFEMPGAGHALTWKLLLKLMAQGVEIVTLTHAAGISSTGNQEYDRSLPGEESFEIPEATHKVLERAKSQRKRIIAVGTSVVRALESSALGLEGQTKLRIGRGFPLTTVDAVLTGTHDVTESHYDLTRAFAPESTLKRASQLLEKENFLTHEFGDFCLIFK